MEDPCAGGGECPVGYVNLLPQNVEALNLYNDIEVCGWEMVRDCRELWKTPAEMEMILVKYKTIKNTIAQCRLEDNNE